MKTWGEQLYADALQSWLSRYDTGPQKKITVALITAGNIPLVGFHDLICVLLSGHDALVRCASNDRTLLPFMWDRLTYWAPGLKGRCRFTEKTLDHYDAIIATGSTNTSRYFEYYFGTKPHIIRKNRNSVAVLTGEESPEQLAGLAEDVFRYFGMGCRSVSKLFVPSGYNFDPLFQAFYRFKDLILHQKYANNYDYNKAVFLMSGDPMLDNGFILLKEDDRLGSPIGTLFFEHYERMEAVEHRLKAAAGELQCVVGPASLEGSIGFGESQQSAQKQAFQGICTDGVDTLEFLFGEALN